jgi:hypothetical protein
MHPNPNNQPKNQMTHSEQTQKVLTHRNWTGLSLAELAAAGRIVSNDTNIRLTLKGWANASLGPVTNIHSLNDRSKVLDDVISRIAAIPF